MTGECVPPGRGGPVTDELPYGFTVDDLYRIARGAAWSYRGGLFMDREEATDIAAVAIVERLYSGEPATRRDLYKAADRAIDNENGREEFCHGIPKKVPQGERRDARRPHFAAYWYGLPALTVPFEDTLVEVIAVRQLWNALPERYRETLLTLIEHGSNKRVCAALGLTQSGWSFRLHAARKTARRIWYSPEAPAPQWGYDFPGSKVSARDRLTENRRRRSKSGKKQDLTREAVAV